MPQSLAKILVHTVFSTKDRRPFLRDKILREEVHRYLGGILTNHDCHSIWSNPQTERKEAIPHHNEIKKFLARSICRNLSVPVPPGD